MVPYRVSIIILYGYEDLKTEGFGGYDLDLLWSRIRMLKR